MVKIYNMTKAALILASLTNIALAEDIPQWRVDYLQNSETTLIENYEGDFPYETYTWLESKGFKNSLLQAIGPNPKVLKNIHEIKSGVSQDIAEKYSNIIFGIAMARATDGIGSVAYTPIP